MENSHNTTQKIRLKKHRKKKKRLKKSDLKMYLGIIVACFIVSIALYFVLEKGGTAIDQINKLADAVPDESVLDSLQQLEKGTSGGFTSESSNRSSKSKTGIDMNNLQKMKETAKKQMSPDELERLKKAYQDYKGNN